MNKIILLLVVSMLSIFIVGCGSNNNINSNYSENEVIINLPKDDSVNGYRTESYKSNTSKMPDTIKTEDVGISSNSEKDNDNSNEYCGNKNSKVFHKSNCDSITSMKDENKYYASKDTLLKSGYKACGRCSP